MGTLFISLLTLILLLISAFIVLIVLMQRTSQSGGMGAALGGGAAESAFGAETNSILMKGTIYGIVAFFVVALGLYLMYQSAAADRVQEVDLNTVITAGESSAATDAIPSMFETSNTDGTEGAAAGSDGIEAAVQDAIESIPSGAVDPLPATN
ncbi:MAG: preprotein translocase subunit SecG [Opitutales bacterium]